MRKFLSVYRITLLCWLLPLVAGLGIFFAWLMTRQQWLEEAGIYTILAGCLLSLTGILALPRLQAKSDPAERRGTLRQSILCVLLLTSNFFVAAGIVIAVANISMEELPEQGAD